MKTDINLIIKRLKKEYPQAKIALEYSNPIELLVATILSAQCTDKRVNIVTKELFKKYKNVSAFANADLKTFEQEIRSTGFYHNKARNIINAAKMIIEKYGGKIPHTMEEILSLPGVARKTANVVLANAYNIVEGIVVDTHVRRITQRLALTKNDNPEKIELDLMNIVPKSEWKNLPNLLQALGRTVCIARNPIHSKCILKDICPSVDI